MECQGRGLEGRRYTWIWCATGVEARSEAESVGPATGLVPGVQVE